MITKDKEMTQSRGRKVLKQFKCSPPTHKQTLKIILDTEMLQSWYSYRRKVRTQFEDIKSQSKYIANFEEPKLISSSITRLKLYAELVT